tara:strand:+ start:693 stop:854 length:162 start_codon:yes stop_codon:yes gene_type:complete
LLYQDIGVGVDMNGYLERQIKFHVYAQNAKAPIGTSLGNILGLKIGKLKRYID